MDEKQELKRLFANDHVHLDVLLARATGAAGSVQEVAYAEFRGRLFHHVAVEEEAVFPELQREAGAPLAIFERLRLDHQALRALLRLTPSVKIIEIIRTVLAAHHLVEEAPGGLHDLLDRLGQASASALLTQLRQAPAHVDVVPVDDSSEAIAAARLALEQAGLDIVATELDE